MSSSGAKGSSGEKGEQGEKGEAGTSIHMLEGAPSVEEGAVGDVYINKENGHLYGPKTKSNWPYCGSIVGLEGLEGPQGLTGAQGEKGATGSQGVQGAEGPKGSTGTAGATGSAGAQGPAGEKGSTGSTGSEGPRGLTGLPGSTGATGPEGPKGATGSQGIQGVEGPKGTTGSTGATGPTGTTGAKGETGVAGEKGAVGSTGPEGASFSVSAPVTGISITSGIAFQPKTSSPCTLKVLATLSGLLGSGLVKISTCSTETGSYSEVGKFGVTLATGIELGQNDTMILVPTAYWVKVVVTGVTVGNVALSGVRWDI